MTTTAPPRRPGSRRAGGSSGGRSPGAGAASAEALKGTSPQSPSRPSLRLVRPPRRFRPRLLGSLAVTIGFITLFVVAAMQAVLVQGQLKLDKLDAEVSARETIRSRLQAQIDQLESPDRLAQQAAAIGMVTPPEVVFLYASPPAASASATAAAAAAPAGTTTPAANTTAANNTTATNDTTHTTPTPAADTAANATAHG